MDAKAMFSFSYGLYVVSANDGENVGACLINTALQVTGDPLQVAVTLNKQNHTTPGREGGGALHAHGGLQDG